MHARFRDRRDAGRQLAALLAEYAGRPDTLVLALPRGGVPVAFEVAAALRAPLDIFLVRKVGVPGHEELAMGAIASGGLRVLNQDIIADQGVPPEVVDAVSRAELRELERRERAYRGARPPPDLSGRAVILVDDGLATGATMMAAVAALRGRGPAQIVIAVPVAPRATLDAFRRRVDAVVCALVPRQFEAVGEWYDDFSQTSDDEVRRLLAAALPGNVAEG
jgi:predicted phosphoribosyltransferase